MPRGVRSQEDSIPGTKILMEERISLVSKCWADRALCSAFLMGSGIKHLLGSEHLNSTEQHQS